MRDLTAQTERYLNETLGVEVTLVPWEGEVHVPHFLQDRYRFFVCRLVETTCLFMVDKADTEESPASVRKHVEQVQKTKWAQPVVYVRERVSAYVRKRLIEQKVPFLVPGNQMYLPMLGIELREHFRRLRPAVRKFNPATQAVLIHALLRGTDDMSPTELAPQLGYSVMTISRALDELEAAGLGQSSLHGRERYLHFGEPRPEVWKKAQPFLRSPVKSQHVIRIMQHRELPGPRAGLSALAEYSMLSEPQSVAIALRREDWTSLQQQDAVEEAALDEPGALSVEVWTYAPTLFASRGLVDRLSLYLSLCDTEDERVAAALDRMMGDLEW